MPNFVLIDGNNLSYRAYYAHKSLTHGKSLTGLIYGVFRDIVALKKEYPDYFFVVAWDGGHKRRTEESQEAVERGLIPSVYKEGRKEKQGTEDYDNICEQMDDLKRGLEFVRLKQVWIEGYEADDVIYTYACKAERKGVDDVVIVSGDHDFYQAISDIVRVYSPKEKLMMNKRKFVENFGFDPSLFVHYGAIVGEPFYGDNIHGVKGWGDKNARKYVAEHGNIYKIREYLENKSRNATEEKFMVNPEVLELALSLKKMDEIEKVPKLKTENDSDRRKNLISFMSELGMNSLVKDIKWLI